MDNAAKTAFLCQIPLLQPLSTLQIAQLAASAEYRRASRWEFVYRPGDDADKIYFLYSGRIKIGSYASDEEQREVIKDLLRTEAVFGESILIGERTRTEFAQVLSKTAEYLAVPNSNFMAMLAGSQRMMQCCLLHMSRRLQRIEDRLAQVLVKDARKRIIEFLLDVARKEGLPIGYETVVRDFLPHHEIANLTGTCRQTVTAVMSELKKSNLIHFDRRSILFRDVSKLA